MYWIYNVVVDGFEPSRVSKVLMKRYGRWMHLSNNISPSSYNIVLKKCSGKPVLRNNIVEICLEKSGWRDIVKAIEHGRALLRLGISWVGDTYRLGVYDDSIEEYSVHPAYDIFIWRNDNETWILDELGLEYGSNPLIHKGFAGTYTVYSGPNIIGKIYVPDKGFKIRVEEIENQVYRNDLYRFIEVNKPLMTRFTNIVYRFYESLGEPDLVLVSFSGGKDSLVVLDTCIKYFGHERVVAVYVDTGVDFPSNREYVGEVEEKLGITIDKVYAPVKELVGEKGFPTRSDRWCTLVKNRAFYKALEKYLEKYRRILVVVGDRDTESYKRSRKPPVRKRKKYLEVAPIKQWATIHVQLYICMNNLPENPLYRLGFYRLGCYICPELTSLEKYIMLNKLYSRLREEPWFIEWINKEKQYSYKTS